MNSEPSAATESQAQLHFGVKRIHEAIDTMGKYPLPKRAEAAALKAWPMIESRHVRTTKQAGDNSSSEKSRVQG